MKATEPSQKQTKLVWNDLSLHWSKDTHGLFDRDFNLSMCADDLGSDIWAYFYRLEKQSSPNPLKIEECSDKLQTILIQAIPNSRYGDNLIDTVMGFARMVASEFVANGDVPYEACGGFDVSGEVPRLERARLSYVYPDSLMKVGHRLYQVVPRGQLDEELDGRIVRLDPERIVTFKPPRQYIGPLRRMRVNLPRIGQSQKNMMERATSGRAMEDYTATRRLYDICVARLSATIGWDGRRLWTDHIADYHWMYRRLRWHRFCIEVCNNILQGINRVFEVIGAWDNESPRLVWSSLPTIEQVDAAEIQIATKGGRFDELLRPFSYRRDE